MSKEKKIPTILGLIILIGGVFVGVFLTNKNTNFISKASGDCSPINPQITNITNNSASISFLTESSCLSSLLINNQIIENMATLSDSKKSKIHYFDISNLEDSSDYEYYFINDGKNYRQSSYKLKTATNPNSLVPSSNLAWGRVYTPDLKAASKVIVFVDIPGASLLSALVTSSGNWNISLANSFNESKTNRFTPPPNTLEEIIVIDQEKQITQITSNTSQNDPTPDIILGQNKFSSSPITFDTETNSGYLPSVSPVSNSKELDILNPKDEESISTKKPDFFGTGPINSKIRIKVESPVVYNDEIYTNSDGSWNWSPPSDLTPGEHTITVTVNENGKEKTVSRRFTVLAADNSPSYSASPSATISLPTSTPTPIIPIITPIPSPTPTPTFTPTTTIKSSKPSTSSGIPVSGSLIPTFALFLISSSFIAFSFLSFKKK